MSEALRRPPDPEPGEPNVPGPPPETRRLQSARREMAFQSMLELGRELTVALDIYQTADLLLFNLMGQLGTARSALWLTPEPGGAAAPVLLRAHGFRRPLLEAVGSSCAPALDRRFRDDPKPLLAWSIASEVGSHEFEILRLLEVAVLAPLHVRGERLGWLAIGTRLDGSPYAAEDLEVLEATLGMVAVALQNAHLYNRERESTRRLRSANEHLVELNRLKNEFLSNVNHELRTPLAVVIATLDAVVQDPRVDAQLRGLLEASCAQSLKLKRLIENLLSLSEASSDRLMVEMAPGDLNALAARVHADHQPGTSAGFRELRLQLRPGLSLGRFDAQRLQQVVDELIDNAIKFTPQGTCIELRTDRFHEDGIDWVGIEVADDGPGVPRERIASMFTPFQQGDGSSTRTAGGLGMGLTWARAIAERMEGRLAVESAPGEGLRVRVLVRPA